MSCGRAVAPAKAEPAISMEIMAANGSDEKGDLSTQVKMCRDCDIRDHLRCSESLMSDSFVGYQESEPRAAPIDGKVDCIRDAGALGQEVH